MNEMVTEILKPVYLTLKGLERLNMELYYLGSVRRVEIAEALHETQGGGDSVDNTEYQAVRYEQLLLEMRIAELQRKISAALGAEIPDSEDVVNRVLDEATDSAGKPEGN